MEAERRRGWIQERPLFDLLSATKPPLPLPSLKMSDYPYLGKAMYVRLPSLVRSRADHSVVVALCRMRFKSPHATDLSFEAEQFVRVLGKAPEDDDWSVGETLDGAKKGIFPKVSILLLEEGGREGKRGGVCAVRARFNRGREQRRRRIDGTLAEVKETFSLT